MNGRGKNLYVEGKCGNSGIALAMGKNSSEAYGPSICGQMWPSKTFNLDNKSKILCFYLPFLINAPFERVKT